MSKQHYFVEEESGWEDGVWKKTITYKPVEIQESQLIKEAIALKEVARAQQKLLQQHRLTLTLVPAKSIR
jgi:hypothetical protein